MKSEDEFLEGQKEKTPQSKRLTEAAEFSQIQ